MITHTNTTDIGIPTFLLPGVAAPGTRTYMYTHHIIVNFDHLYDLLNSFGVNTHTHTHTHMHAFVLT